MSRYTHPPAPGLPLSANDRLKRSFGSRLWGSMIVATALHFMVFAFFPELQAEDYSTVVSEIEAIELPPELDFPPPPEAIARPALPVISDAVFDDDVTISDMVFDLPAMDEVPPAPPALDREVGVFTPFTVAPSLLNASGAERVLQREYPSILRDAGIGGQVGLLVYIDEEGVVQEARVQESSGHPLLDAAALRAVESFRFRPAMNLDRHVPVWIALPVTFQSRQEGA
jgi:periplasmic protein TonB